MSTSAEGKPKIDLKFHNDSCPRRLALAWNGNFATRTTIRYRTTTYIERTTRWDSENSSVDRIRSIERETKPRA